LEPLLKDPVTIENEYARIAAEQGIPGLILWVAFIVWLLTRPRPRRFDPWHVGRWLARLFCAISFAAAPIGTGLLNAVPQTAMLLMFAGWIASPQTGPVPRIAAEAGRRRSILTPRQV
jgi:O-antigen ligase